MREKKSVQMKKYFLEFFKFFENILGDHFYISQFVPLYILPALGKIQRVSYEHIFQAFQFSEPPCGPYSCARSH